MKTLARKILDTQEILNQQEYDLCFSHYWEETRVCMTQIGMRSDLYLNLNVYSEADKEAHDLRKEIGF